MRREDRRISKKESLEILSKGEKKNALIQLIEKYSADYLQEGIEYINKSFSKVNIIKLSIESFSGKARKTKYQDISFNTERLLFHTGHIEPVEV